MNKLKFDLKPRYHFLFWCIYFLLNFFRWGAYFNDYEYSLKSNIIEFSLHIPFVYFNLLVLIPKYILESKYYKFSVALLMSLLLVYLLKTGLTYYMISENIWPEANREYKAFEINHVIAVCIGELYVLAMAASIYLTFTWLKERDKSKYLKNKQLKIKLKYLKNQIQPHFFFNTLNNLYSLSLNSSNKVPDVIIKLSRLMEYVLYDIKDKAFISLLKELEYIQNYMDIEKLRFEKVDITVNIESNIDEVEIPPFLLITLVENAFKHGGFERQYLEIKINCHINNKGYLMFQVINNYTPTLEDIKQKKGIGIKNTKKRLNLIFKGNFILENKIKFNYYITNLQIPVN